MAARRGVVDRDHGYREALADVFGVLRSDFSLKVGIRQDKGADEVAPGISLAELATIHEFGAPNAHIPSRPFLRSTLAAYERKYADLLTKAVQGAIDGKRSLRIGLERIGIVIVGDVQLRMASFGSFRPNAPATIARKGSSMPLIDTGRLRQSIDYELSERDSGKG